MLLDNNNLYERYEVEVEVLDRLDGGVPKNPEIIEKWVKARTKFDDDLTKKQIEDHVRDIKQEVEDTASGMWCGFKADDVGIYIDARQVKALLRECMTMLGISQDKRGSKQIYQHGLEVKGQGARDRHKIYLVTPAAGQAHPEPPDLKNEETPIHVQTPQGPRSALKRVDYVPAGTRLTFEVWIMATHPQEKRHLGQRELEDMLTLAQEDGLGANRSQGCGKFEVMRFDVLNKPAPSRKAPEPKTKTTKTAAKKKESKPAEEKAA